MKKKWYIIGVVLFLSSCEMVENVKQWQKEYLSQRYSGKTESPKQIEDWQKEAQEYQDEMEQVVKAAKNASSVYRSLANTFARQEAWQLCTDHMQKAIEFGNNNSDTLFDLATCQGNLARSQNWQPELARQAENTLLAILTNEPNSVRARYQLALIYFYGFGLNNPYRVLSNILTIEQKEFQQQAMALLQQAAILDEQNDRVFHLMAVIYSAWGEKQNSLTALNQEIEILRKKDPQNYTTTLEYKQAIESMQRWGESP